MKCRYKIVIINEENAMIGDKDIDMKRAYFGMEERMNSIRLKRLTVGDMELYKEWLYKPHVSKWYEHPEDWIDEAEKRDREYIWIHMFIAWHGSTPIGFCQYYPYAKSGENWHGGIELEGTYSIDYLIGDENFLRQGFGREIVRMLAVEVFGHRDAKRIIVKPDSRNMASCNTLVSAGLRYDDENQIYIIERYEAGRMLN